MAKRYGRRRAIAIIAAVAGLPLLRSAHASAGPTLWEGQALGAPAQLILNHPDRSHAAVLVDRAVAEIARLEMVFSLYRDDSALSELNRTGFLVAPPADLVSLLKACSGFWEASNGAFDPTVQPLWALYRDHFSTPGADPAGPSSAQVGRALGLVGFDRVKFNRDRIVMPPGTAMTLNGIAQGYITDRIVDMLRQAGVTDSFVDMGEARAIGSRQDGTPWRVGLADSQASDRPDVVLGIVNKAVATSSSAGFHFDEAGRFGHLLDPRRGTAPDLYRRLSVVADDATTADALSTAFSLSDEPAMRSMAAARPDLAIDLVTAGGVHHRFGARL